MTRTSFARQLLGRFQVRQSPQPTMTTRGFSGWRVLHAVTIVPRKKTDARILLATAAARGEKQLSKRVAASIFRASMPKSISRSKTRKAVAKRFKITGTRQGFAAAIFSPPSAFVQERQAQTPLEQIGPRRQDRRSANQSESAVRLNSASYEVRLLDVPSSCSGQALREFLLRQGLWIED